MCYKWFYSAAVYDGFSYLCLYTNAHSKKIICSLNWVIRCKSIVHIKIKSDIPLITWIYPTFYNWSKVLHKNNKILYLICRCGRMIRKLVVLLFCIRDCHAWRRRTMLVNVLLQKWAAFLRKLEIPSQINKCT